MAAIVTDSFRRNNAQFFLNDIASADSNYYVGLGKSEKWTVDEEALLPGDIPASLGIEGDSLDIKSNLVTLLKINETHAELVIPHIKWKSEAYYKAYSPYDPDCFYPSILEGGDEINPCYAVVSGRIYLCLQRGQGKTAGIPVATDYRATTYAGDGYVWILVDNISTALSKLITDQFINITSGVISEAIQPLVENDGGGLLYGFSVLDGGSGYGSLNEVTFVAQYSNGTSTEIDCPVVADVNAPTGSILEVLLPGNWSFNASTSKKIVGGYFKIDSTGSGAVIVPHIAPLRGFAHEPSRVLPSWFIGIAIDAADDISNDGFYIPYRQISVLKGVQYDESASPDSLAAARYLTLASTPSSSISVGDKITFGTTGITAYFDSYVVVENESGSSRRLYFHQNSTTGYGDIPSNGSITDSKGMTVQYTSIHNNEYIAGSGDVIFTENRKPINRQSGQTEEIKIIIQF